MKIKDLQYKYTKSSAGSFGSGDIFEMDNKKSFLLSVVKDNNSTLKLTLKTNQNEVTAYVRAKNTEEEKFLDFLEKELSEKFIGKNYDEIISIDFQI